MTRKKYIKKLMSCGMQRNAAERLARAAAASGVSYEEEWTWRCCVAALTDARVRLTEWLITLNVEAVDRAAKKMMEDARYEQH